MILPTKNIPTDQALLVIAGQVLLQLERPATVTSAWERFSRWREANNMPSFVPFWWFSLAVDVLYAMGSVEYSDGLLRRQNAA